MGINPTPKKGKQMVLEEIKGQIAVLVQQAYELGVQAQVPPVGAYTQEQLDAAVLQAKADEKAALKAAILVKLQAQLDAELSLESQLKLDIEAL